MTEKTYLIGAIIMRTRVTVFADDSRTFKAKKEGGKDFTVHTLQCLMHTEKQLVGELRVPHDLVPADVLNAEKLVPPGDYFVDWGISRDYETKEIKSRLVEFIPFGPAQKPAAKAEGNQAAGVVQKS